MGLRIKTNVPSLTAQRNLETTSGRATESMEKLSSGYRINKAADDAAGLAISDTQTASIRSLSQAKRNAADGVSLIQVAEGSMNEISNILVRLKELATQAASDTIGARERSYTNKEYVQLVDEIDRISNSTEFNGIQLLKGSADNAGLVDDKLSIHVSQGDALVENRDTITINIEDLKMNSEEVLGLTKGEEIGPEDPAADFSREAATQRLETINKALQTVAGTRSILGSKQSRLNSTINNLGVAIENTSAARSRIRDVDYAAETAAYTQTSILAQAGVSVLAQANSMPGMAMTLIGG